MTQRSVLIAQKSPLIGTLDHHFELGQVERLGDVVVGTQFHGFHSIVDVAVPGDEDDLHVGIALAQFHHELDAVGVGQPDVQHHHLVGGAPQPFTRLPGTTGHMHGARWRRQFLFQQLADGWFVIHCQHGITGTHVGHSLGSGKVTVNTDPSPSLLSTLMSPPCSVTMV